MKNQATIQNSIVSESLEFIASKVQSLTFAQLMHIVGQWILSTKIFLAMSAFCSLVLGEKVPALKAFNLLHAFVAFFAMLLLGGDSWIIQSALVLWFAITALQCKRDGWNEKE